MPDALRLVVSAVLLLAAMALAVVAVLALTGRLHRNRWAGVRTPATMAGAEAFAAGNRVAGPPLLAAAVLLVLASLGEVALKGAVAPVTMVLGLAGAAAMVMVGGVLGNRAAACVPQRCADCTGCVLMDSLT